VVANRADVTRAHPGTPTETHRLAAQSHNPTPPPRIPVTNQTPSPLKPNAGPTASLSRTGSNFNPRPSRISTPRSDAIATTQPEGCQATVAGASPTSVSAINDTSGNVTKRNRLP
jgi:hypothetical protein